MNLISYISSSKQKYYLLKTRVDQLYINYTIVIKPAGQPNNPLIKNLTNQYVNLMTY